METKNARKEMVLSAAMVSPGPRIHNSSFGPDVKIKTYKTESLSLQY